MSAKEESELFKPAQRCSVTHLTRDATRRGEARRVGSEAGSVGPQGGYTHNGTVADRNIRSGTPPRTRVDCHSPQKRI